MSKQERDARLIQNWAVFEALQADQSLRPYGLDCNNSLLFDYLKSQALLINPKTVSEALRFAQSNSNRLPNGSQLAVKQVSRIQEEADAKAQAEAEAAAEKARLAAVEQENRRFALVEFIAKNRAGKGATADALRIERGNVAHWPIEKLEAENSAIQMRADWRGKSAAEFKAGVLDPQRDAKKLGELVLPADLTAKTFCAMPASKIRILVRSYTARGYSDRAVWQAINERVAATRGGNS